MSAQGNHRGAIVLFRNALEKDSNDSEVRYLLAESYRMAERFEQAEREYAAVLDLDPQRSEVLLRLAELHILAGKPEPAFKRIEDYLLNAGDSAHAYALLGRAQMLTDEAKAEKTLRWALEIDPGHLEAHQSLAEILLQRGALDEARAELAAILERDAGHLEALRLMARLEIAGGDRDRALAHLRRIVGQDPFDAESGYTAGLILLEKGDVDGADREAERMLKGNASAQRGHQLKGMVLFVRRDFDQAVNHFTMALENRIDLSIYHYLGLSYFQLGKRELALSQFQRFLDYRPEAPQPRLMAAVILLSQERTDEGIRELQILLERNPEHALAQALLGSAYLSRGELDRAMAAFDRATSLDPGLAHAHAQKGIVSLSQGKIAEGERELLQALAASPGMLDSRLLLALHYLERRAFGEVIPLLQEGLTGGDSDALIHNYLAMAYLGEGRIEEGTAALRKAKEIKPEYLTSYYNLAAYHVRTGDLTQAKAEYETLVRIAPGEKKALLLSAELTEAMGEPEEALALYRKVAERFGPETPVQFAQGALLHRLGRHDEAEAVYRRILEKDAEFTPALNNLAYLYAKRTDTLPSALGLARRAYAAEPKNPFVLDTLGYVLVKSGEAREAIPLLEKAARELPRIAEVQYHLGIAYRAQGRTEEGLAALRKALALGQFPETAQVRSLVNEEEGRP